MKSNILKAALVAVTVLGVSVPAWAGPLITDYEGGSQFGSYYGGIPGDVIGFRFTAVNDLTITKLGVLLDPADGVLNSTHQVGLWRNADQALLGSVVVNPATGQLIDGFVYENLGAAVSLSAGAGYTLGALYTYDDGDSYVSYPSTLGTSNISSTVAVYPASEGLGFVYPTLESIGNLARLGPNAYADVVNTIPVPASVLLAGLGAGLVARFRGRTGSK